jgi:uncharacterized protein with FMN-binding domain
MTVTKKRKGHKAMWVVILVILGVLVVGAFVVMMVFEPGRREAMSVTVGAVDFSKLTDGVYEGQYQGTKDHLRDAKVAVTVASGQVEKISVIGGAMANEKQSAEIRNGQSLDTLFQRVIDAGSLQVDTISGATITSKVHLKAVENALEQAEGGSTVTAP